MKVKELIEKLNGMPSDAKIVVIIPYDGENLTSYVEDISLNSDNEIELV